MSSARLIALPLTALLIAVAVWASAEVQRSAATTAAERVEVTQRLKTAMLDQETGLRGYQITGRQDFLEPYRRGGLDYAEAQRMAEARAGDDREAREMIERGAGLAGRWRVLAQEEIANGGGRQPRPADIARRKALMDEFRRTNDALQAHFEERRYAAQRRGALLSVAISLGVFLLVAGLGSYLLRRRERAEAEREEAERRYRDGQAEYMETLQTLTSEEDARRLISHHLERRSPGREVTVLDSGDGACLALRTKQPHSEHGGRLLCERCGGDGEALCKPLLVSGRAIGAVLVRQPGPFDEEDRRCVRDSVAQAAPVLWNLRAVAVAEQRAATDALTGLPNRRAVDETVTRMAAHARRSDEPLAALSIDLDHFKSINDTYGHEKGDEVLAAAGAVMADTIRASDFVGRAGGEEFLVLAPDTGADGALTLAEKLRAAIGTLDVAGVDRPITASLGVAVMPIDGSEGETLLRRADRALYAAKHGGRNRVEAATRV
jgi:diguanylate cyclase (GGDEF)-like protein